MNKREPVECWACGGDKQPIVRYLLIDDIMRPICSFCENFKDDSSAEFQFIPQTKDDHDRD